ncbi:radical SAM protein [Kitasatospora sp. GP82]|uniref:radical SAM protein n=1 Tax=Kitasatospora sp. GP82 TaxID=3035089 RepID=UPI002475F114|nr:radical SAM protein [Kitasatospora sp. GP82]MDH6128387.1 molybdenum cofactor biosynthesis enzyme MoaA [Kitasatospora sp. GP82]
MIARTTPTTAVPQSRLQSARFYITFRCNSLCGYCNVWQDDKFKGYQELTLERACQILDELYELGVRYIDFTGGEPVLHPHINGIVQYAKSLGMTVEITSNGIRFAKHIDAIVPYVDTMNVSLDTLRPDRYRQIRGVPTLDRALDVIQRVIAAGSGNLKLICVVTRENVDEIPDLLRFAQENRITVYFSGMFDYFDEQDTVRDTNRTARKLKLIEQNGKPLAAPAGRAGRMNESEPTTDLVAAELIRLLYQPFALINLHFRKYVENLDPTAPTDCYANKRILTVGPDGRLVLPCYHAFDNSVQWNRPLRELVQDPEFLRVRDEEVGHRTECRGCTVFPYIGLSFSYRFDKIFLYQAISEEIAKIKTRFVDPLPHQLALDHDALQASYAELEKLIDNVLPAPLPPLSSDHFYRFEATGTGVATEFTTGELSLAELLGDHAQAECWGIQRSPHTWMRLVYRDLVPALKELADAGMIPQEAYETLVGELYEVQLAWWQGYLARYYRGCENADTQGAQQVLARFIERTTAMLPNVPRATRVREVLLHAGCVLGLAPEQLAPLAVHSSFPEASLIAKHLLLTAEHFDLPKYAELLPAQAAEPLRLVVEEPDGAEDPAWHGHLDAETARLLGYQDPVGAVDQATAERLVKAVLALAAQQRAGFAERLLAHELCDPQALRRRGVHLRERSVTRAHG